MGLPRYLQDKFESIVADKDKHIVHSYLAGVTTPDHIKKRLQDNENNFALHFDTDAAIKFYLRWFVQGWKYSSYYPNVYLISHKKYFLDKGFDSYYLISKYKLIPFLTNKGVTTIKSKIISKPYQLRLTSLENHNLNYLDFEKESKFYLELKSFWYEITVRKFHLTRNLSDSNKINLLRTVQEKQLDRIYAHAECMHKIKEYKNRVFNQRNFPPTLKYIIFERDNYTCQICNTHKSNLITGIHLEVDHIKEWCDGGLTTYDNGQTVCSQCNKGKHHAKKYLVDAV